MPNGWRTEEEIERNIAAMREWVKKYKNPDERMREGIAYQAKRLGQSYEEHRAMLMAQARAQYGNDIYDDVPAPTGN